MNVRYVICICIKDVVLFIKILLNISEIDCIEYYI